MVLIVFLPACSGMTTLTDTVVQTQTATQPAEKITTTLTVTQPAQPITETVTSAITSMTTSLITTTVPTATTTTQTVTTATPAEDQFIRIIVEELFWLMNEPTDYGTFAFKSVDARAPFSFEVDRKAIP